MLVLHGDRLPGSKQSLAAVLTQGVQQPIPVVSILVSLVFLDRGERLIDEAQQEVEQLVWLDAIGVDFFLDGYVKDADAHERMGDLAGARERNRLIAQLKQLRSEMLLLAEAERQGRWTPSWEQVPSLPSALA